MTTPTLPSSRVSFAHFLFLLAAISISATVPARAAQETFWPFNLYPPPASSLSYADDSTISVTVPGVGSITSRHVELSEFGGSIVLPALNNSAAYNNANTRFDSESSLDGGANWAPYVGFGATSLTLRQTNNTAGVRRFEMELSSQNMPVNGAYGAALVRESPTLASLGELVVTATNGGYFYRGFVNFRVEVSVDDGGNWFLLAPAARVELSGAAGSPARLSISRSDTTATICWQTEASGAYQLQRIDAVGGTNWTNVGSPQPGNGSHVCVTESISPGTNQIYRLQLSP